MSTTVDEELLATARNLRAWRNDAALLDAGLRALVASHRTAQIDEAYRVYDERPLSEADDWGDLDSFRAGAAST